MLFSRHLVEAQEARQYYMGHGNLIPGKKRPLRKGRSHNDLGMAQVSAEWRESHEETGSWAKFVLI
jgi:hypothetical protein